MTGWSRRDAVVEATRPRVVLRRASVMMRGRSRLRAVDRAATAPPSSRSSWRMAALPLGAGGGWFVTLSHV